MYRIYGFFKKKILTRDFINQPIIINIMFPTLEMKKQTKQTVKLTLQIKTVVVVQISRSSVSDALRAVTGFIVLKVISSPVDW